MRSVSCSDDISMLKIAAGTPFSIAANSAMFTARVDLPIDGRPAITTRSPGCRPVVLRSSSVNPVGHAAHLARVLVQRVEPVDRLRQDVADRDESRRPRLPRSAMANTRRSASSTNSCAARPRPSVAEAAISPPAVTSCRRIERSRMISA